MSIYKYPTYIYNFISYNIIFFKKKVITNNFVLLRVVLFFLEFRVSQVVQTVRLDKVAKLIIS